MKKIIRPRDKTEINYNGSLPLKLAIGRGGINFTIQDVDMAFKNGTIDDVNREFLRRVLAIYEVRPSVVRDISEYRARIKNGMKPGQDMFIQMQELGLRHHIGMSHRGKPVDLDISGYTLPEVNLSGGVLPGSLIMNGTVVRNDVNLNGMVIGGHVERNGIHVGGNIYQIRTEIGKSLHQDRAVVGGRVIE